MNFQILRASARTKDERCCHVPIVFTENGWQAKTGVPANWPMILVSWYGANAYAPGLESMSTMYRESYRQDRQEPGSRSGL